MRRRLWYQPSMDTAEMRHQLLSQEDEKDDPEHFAYNLREQQAGNLRLLRWVGR